MCEFTHWDYCQTGLVKDDDEFFFCEARDDGASYEISPIHWTDECDKYLADYRKAYTHWFHDGKQRVGYSGWDLMWFSEKWGERNPIKEAVT